MKIKRKGTEVKKETKMKIGFKFFWMCALVFRGSFSAQGKPNVLVILTDDLGSYDLGVQGAPDVK